MLNHPFKYFLILLLCASCAKKPVYKDFDNMDYGLPLKPDASEYFDVETDDFDVYGVSNIDTFYIDINNNGKKDKITRGRFSNISAHGYTFYEIILDSGEKIPRFKTVEAADCFLTVYKFDFKPFVLTKATRNLGPESWIEPTLAKIEKFEIINNKLEKISEESGPVICDVRELIYEN